MNFEKWNLNYHIKVKLNRYGREIHRKYFDDLDRKLGLGINNNGAKTDEFGYTEYQCWQLMKIFGPYMNEVTNEPFDFRVLIKREDNNNES